MPEMTSTLAATTMPAIFAGADTSRRSSITPTTAMSTAAMTSPSASVLPSKMASKDPMSQATPMPTSTPSSIETPPRVGVGRSCTRRSSGRTTAPMRSDTLRTTKSDAKVVPATAARITA